MRYHVPFAHRQRPHGHRPGPIYIGFDEPVSIQRRRGRFNWFGFMGLLMVLISPLTLFAIAPVALIFCLIGMRRSPRGMATVGLVLSVMATAALTLGVIGVASHNAELQNARQRAWETHQRQIEIRKTNAILDDAKQELREFRAENDFNLPGALDGNIMMVQHLDAWETELRYEPNPDGCIVRSAGPDKRFSTSDDVIAKLDGKTDNDPYFGY